MNDREEIDDDDIVLILESKNQVFAEMVMEALKAKDIPVLIKSATGYYLRGMLPIDQGFFNLKLYVQGRYKDEASEIVETIVPPEEII